MQPICAQRDISIKGMRRKPIRLWRTLILYYYNCDIKVLYTSRKSYWVLNLIFFSGEGRCLFEGGSLFQIISLRWGAYLKQGAYLKLGTNLSIYCYFLSCKISPRLWLKKFNNINNNNNILYSLASKMYPAALYNFIALIKKCRSFIY